MRVFLLAFLCAPAFAQPAPPTPPDLQAAYCLGVINERAAALVKLGADTFAPDVAAAARSLESMRARVSGYLVARTMLIDDPSGLLVAAAQGKRDWGEFVTQVDRCVKECKDLACVAPCAATGEVKSKMDRCARTDYLPY